MLELKEEEQTFTFEDVASEPTPSLLRCDTHYNNGMRIARSEQQKEKRVDRGAPTQPGKFTRTGLSIETRAWDGGVASACITRVGVSFVVTIYT